MMRQPTPICGPRIATTLLLLAIATLQPHLSHGFMLPSRTTNPAAVLSKQPTTGLIQINAPLRTDKVSSTALPAKAMAKKVEIASQSNNFLRGKLLLFVHKFMKSPTVYWDAIRRILTHTYWPEVALIAIMANSQAIGQKLFLMRGFRKEHKKRLARGNEDELTEEEREQERDYLLRKFDSSGSKKISLLLEQFGRLQATLYASDIFWVFLKLLDFKFVVEYQAQRVAGSVIFSTWFAYNMSRVKYYYLKNGIPNLSMAANRRRRAKAAAVTNGEGQGAPMNVYSSFANKLLDVFIYACAFLFLVDLLGIQLGFALKSVFGLGSFGTLVFSLASKDVAAEFVGGLMIQGTNFFTEGETVILQDGTAGEVLKVGWLHTYIKRSTDEYIVRVPNSQISHQRIAREKRKGVFGSKRYS